MWEEEKIGDNTELGKTYYYQLQCNLYTVQFNEKGAVVPAHPLSIIQHPLSNTHHQSSGIIHLSQNKYFGSNFMKFFSRKLSKKLIAKEGRQLGGYWSLECITLFLQHFQMQQWFPTRRILLRNIQCLFHNQNLLKSMLQLVYASVSFYLFI